MLSKILLKNQSLLQLIIASLGALLGVVFLLTSIHFLLKVNEFGEGSEMLGPNTLIIQKKVSSSTTLQMASSLFSVHEIKAISRKSFVKEVQSVKSNNFGVEFLTSDPMLPYFRSDVFIQSIDARFLDVKSTKWNWNLESEYVPIILPRDFLVMLNTFMSSSGIPQISDELAKDVLFSLQLSNNQQKKVFQAKIIGFTNEVSSILVPESFMDFGVQEFGGGKDQKITQLLILGKEKEFGLLEKFLEKNHYESKDSQIVTGRLKSIVSTLLTVIVLISFLTLVFSSFVMVQYIQLLVSRNNYEVKTLLRLGFTSSKIYNVFIRYFIILYGSICLLASFIFIWIKGIIDKQLHQSGIYIDLDYTLLSWLTLLISIVLFYLATFLSTRRMVIKEF